MKKMVCEMCGGNDLLKDGGLLTCQSCGTKYSVEEARRMMVEIDGPVDVSGSTVKVDNSARLDNLYKIARRARDDGNIKQAYKKYEELLVEDPDNWEPNFFTEYFSGLDSLKNENQGGAVSFSGRKVHISYEYRSGISSCISSIHNCLDSVFSLIEDMPDFDKQRGAAATVESYVEIAARYLSDAVDAEHARMKQEIDHFASEAHNDNVIYTAFEKRDGGRKNDYVRSEYIQKISAMTSLVDHRKRLLESVIAKRQKAAAEEETKRRFDEYWKTHKEEKTALEAEKKSLLETVANIIKEIPLIPQKTEGYEEMFQLQKSVENLTAEKNAIGSTPEIVELSQKIEQLAAEKQTLGFFDSKGKKPINEQIVSLEKEIASIQKSKSAAIQEKIDTANNAISPIQARIKQNIKTAYGNISKYQTRIEAIDRKLTIPGSELEELEDIEHMNDTEAYIEEQPQICDKQELCAFCGGEIVRLGFFKVCKSCGEQNN